jgi:hypothetical protein
VRQFAATKANMLAQISLVAAEKDMMLTGSS